MNHLILYFRQIFCRHKLTFTDYLQGVDHYSETGRFQYHSKHNVRELSCDKCGMVIKRKI